MNKRGICIKRNFLLVSFIFLVLISMSFISAYCSDSDNGKDFFKKGSVSGEYKASDYCSDSKNLVEYFCENGKTDFVIYKCDYKCNNGKCISQTEEQTKEQGFLYTLSQIPFFKFIFNIGETNLPAGSNPLNQFCTGGLTLNSDGSCTGSISTDCSTDTQICLELIPAVIREGRTDIYAACLETYWTVPVSYRCDISIPALTSCTPSWTCTSWSSCSSGSQTRTCTDSNNCGTNTGKPVTSQSCTSPTTDLCKDANNNQKCGDILRLITCEMQGCTTNTGQICSPPNFQCCTCPTPGGGTTPGVEEIDTIACGTCSTGQTCENGACVKKICTVGEVCRKSEGECDLPEYFAYDCTCPANTYKAKGTTCGDNTKTCEKDKKCPGDSSICPAEGEKVKEGEACEGAPGTCTSCKRKLSFGCWEGCPKIPGCTWSLVSQEPATECTASDLAYCQEISPGSTCASASCIPA